MWRGKKTQLPAATTWEQPQEALCLPSSAAVPTVWTVDESWCLLVSCTLSWSPAFLPSAALWWGQSTQSRLTLKRNASGCGSCWRPKLLCHSHCEWYHLQSWWVVTFTVTWKEENVKLAMLGIPDWVSCMKTRGTTQYIGFKVKVSFP